MGCQTAITKKIRELEGDYILQVKSNQKTLLENIEDSFSVKKIDSTHTTEDCGHGRVEVRQCDLITNLEFIEDARKWKDLQSIVRIKSTIYNKKTKVETTNARYYIS
jgi:predicted transposase YbfD/YdcC